MDRLWQWVWDRYGAKYPWVIWAFGFTSMLVTYALWSLVITCYERSSRYLEAVVVTSIAVVLQSFVVLPGRRRFRLMRPVSAGDGVDRFQALKESYAWGRAAGIRQLWFVPIWAATFFAIVSSLAGAHGMRVVQYAIVGCAMGIVTTLISVHTFMEGLLRPVRAALAGDSGIGDALPRPRPTFARWLEVSMLSALCNFTTAGVMVGVLLGRVSDSPVLPLVIAGVATAVLARRSPSVPSSRRHCVRSATWPEALNALRQAITPDACRWFRTMTSVRWPGRSTGCRPDWLSGNDFRRRSALMSIQRWRCGCLSRVMTSSPGSAAR